ncbi:MAG TPA: hypothetical protein VKF17_16995 [Isosphaeraceae bacterium]|nr:hypothetical protein [Isosphaeraceae bacterium]
MMRIEPSAEFFDKSKIHAAIKSQDPQSVGESPGIIRVTRKSLAPSRDSAIPRIRRHAIKRLNSARDRPRSVEPDYLASIAVLMCKQIKMHAERLSFLPHDRSASWRGMVILSRNWAIGKDDLASSS